MTEQPTFDELIAGCQRSAVHLEMRDVYTPDDPVYLDWKAGLRTDPMEAYRDWYDLVARTVARGVEMRRARIVSEPITDVIRHEYEVTSVLNVPAGERVRWLPRHRASDIPLPGNDFWLFDDMWVRFGFFAGDGAYVGDEVVRDADVVRLCSSAFETVWRRAIDHSAYRPQVPQTQAHP